MYENVKMWLKNCGKTKRSLCGFAAIAWLRVVHLSEGEESKRKATKDKTAAEQKGAAKLF